MILENSETSQEKNKKPKTKTANIVNTRNPPQKKLQGLELKLTMIFSTLRVIYIRIKTELSLSNKRNNHKLLG